MDREGEMILFRLVAWCLFSSLICFLPVHAGEQPLRIVFPVKLEPPDPHHRFWMVSESLNLSLYGRLARLDGGGRIEPDLAVSWKRTDDTTYRFQLREGVKFHDGRPCTAEDVVFSLKRAKSYPEGVHQARLKSMADVRRISDLEVEIKVDGIDPLLLQKLALIAVVPSKSPMPITRHVGTGPYRWAERPEPERIQFEAFPDYWGAPPEVKSVEMIFGMNRKTALQRLKQGSVDLVEIAHEDADEVDQLEDFWIFSSLSPGVTYLDFQIHLAPFDNPHVRRAVHLALDRESLAKTVFSDYARPAAQLAGPPSFGFDASRPPRARDLAAAREALKKAECPPEALTFELFGTESRQKLLQAVKDQLSEVGFRVQLRIVEWEELIQVLDGHKAQAYVMGWGNILHDLGDAYEHLLHSQDKEKRLGLANTTGISDPEIDRWIDAAGNTFDLEARYAAIQRVTQAAEKRAVLLPLVYEMTLWAGPADLEWEPRSDGLVYPYTIRRKKRGDEASE